jgi:hypothetical protein
MITWCNRHENSRCRYAQYSTIPLPRVVGFMHERYGNLRGVGKTHHRYVPETLPANGRDPEYVA